MYFPLATHRNAPCENGWSRSHVLNVASLDRLCRNVRRENVSVS